MTFFLCNVYLTIRLLNHTFKICTPRLLNFNFGALETTSKKNSVCDRQTERYRSASLFGSKNIRILDCETLKNLYLTMKDLFQDG